MSTLSRAAMLIPLAFGLCMLGCDSDSEDPMDGPSTICAYNFEAATVAADFGQACTSDGECSHGACIMPGDDGNITNEVFGFCTRACDCETSDGSNASLASTDPDYSCIYPGGCYVGQSQGAWRHAAPKCSSVSDCQAIDSRYTDCKTTSSSTVVEKTCGSLIKVCQPHN